MYRTLLHPNSVVHPPTATPACRQTTWDDAEKILYMKVEDGKRLFEASVEDVAEDYAAFLAEG